MLLPPNSGLFWAWAVQCSFSDTELPKMEAGKGDVKEAAQVTWSERFPACFGPLQEFMLLWLKSFMILYSRTSCCTVLLFSVTNMEQCVLQELRLLFCLLLFPFRPLIQIPLSSCFILIFLCLENKTNKQIK